MATIDETDILHAVRRTLDGDSQAFDQVVEILLPIVRGFLSVRCRNLNVADELAQETFVKAFTRLETYRVDQPFTPWVLGIARNLLRNSYRSTQVSVQQVDDLDSYVQMHLDEDSTVDPTAGQLKRLNHCIDRLQGKARELVYRHHVDGEPLKKLAKSFQLKASTLASRLARIRRSLRTCMEAGK